MSLIMRRLSWHITAESALRAVVVIGFIALIEGLCRSGIIPHNTMIAPSSMLMSSIDIVRSGRFNHDIVTTFANIIASSILSVLFGFAIGLALHAVPSARRAVEPFLSAYYAVPTFIFYPIFIVVLGVGARPIIAIAVLLAVVTMITATLNGLDRMPTVMHKTAQVMRLSPWRAAVHIKLPATLPYLFTGGKLSVAYAFIGVIASEFILSGSGIGYAIGYAYNNFQNGDMYGLMFIVLVSVTLVNVALNRIDRRFQLRRKR